MGYRPTTSRDPVLVRASATGTATALTASYVASNPVRIIGQNAVQILLDLSLDTGGGATAANMQIEIATPACTAGGQEVATPAATDWFAITAPAAADPTVATGLAPVAVGRKVLNFSLTDRYVIPLNGLVGKWLRVQIKTTGGPGASTAKVAVVGGTA